MCSFNKVWIKLISYTVLLVGFNLYNDQYSLYKINFLLLCKIKRNHIKCSYTADLIKLYFIVRLLHFKDKKHQIKTTTTAIN